MRPSLPAAALGRREAVLPFHLLSNTFCLYCFSDLCFFHFWLEVKFLALPGLILSGHGPVLPLSSGLTAATQLSQEESGEMVLSMAFAPSSILAPRSKARSP